MPRSRRSTDSLRVWSTQPDPRLSVPAERDVSTGRPVDHDHADKESRRNERHEGSEPRRPATSGRPRGAIPAPRRPTVRSASRRGVQVGGAFVAVAAAAVAAVVGVVLVTSSQTPAPVDTADAVVATSLPGTATSGRPTAPAPTASGASISAGLPGAPVEPVDSGTSVAVPPPGTPVSGAPGPGSSPPVSSRPTSSLPAALDPSRIWGYRSVQVITAVENGGDVIRTGDRFENLFRCRNGSCTPVQGNSPVAFAPAVDRYSHRDVHVDPLYGADSPCMPVTSTFTITRQADGSYRGSGSSVPRATRTTVGTKFCSFPRSSVSTVLTPILLPQLDATAETGPAVLDPKRITGYVGSRVVGGAGTSVTVTCDRGLCPLACPLRGCTFPLFFTAATATATSGPIVLGASCRNGSGTVSLTRDAAGGYVVRARASAEGGPAACTQDISFRLQPVTG